MSQQILVRGSAPSRRGASLVPIIIAIVVIGGAIYGGLAWYSSSGGKDNGSTRTAADSVKSTLGDLEESLKNIEKEPAKANEEIEVITNIANEGITGLAKQAADAPAAVKAQIVALVAEYLPKLQPLIDKAYAVPGVKEKLEPIVTKLMDGIKALGT